MAAAAAASASTLPKQTTNIPRFAVSSTSSSRSSKDNLQSDEVEDFSTDFNICFWKQREQSTRNDLVISVGAGKGQQKNFAANSDIMKARCTFFRDLPAKNKPGAGESTVVDVPEMTPEQFKPFFKYVHTNLMKPFRNMDRLVNGLYAAKKFGQASLEEKCRARLIDKLLNDPVENGLQLLRRTQDFIEEDEVNLIGLAMQIFENNVEAALHSHHFRYLSPHLMKKAICNNHLVADPLLKVEALNFWAEEALRQRDTEIDQEAKIDLCLEDLQTIPVQDIPLNDLYSKVSNLKILSDEMMVKITSHHFDADVEPPFHSTNRFSFHSTFSDGQHQHQEGQFRRRAHLQWTVSPEHHLVDCIGCKLTSSAIVDDQEPGTHWFVDYYPCGTGLNEHGHTSIFLRNRSIGKVGRIRQINTHFRFRIITGDDEELSSREFAYVYTPTESFGTAKFMALTALPREYTIHVDIQWSPVLPFLCEYELPENPHLNKVVAQWSFDKYLRTNLSSPIFGRNGFLWRISLKDSGQFLVQLMRLPKDVASVFAKIKFYFKEKRRERKLKSETDAGLIEVNKPNRGAAAAAGDDDYLMVWGSRTSVSKNEGVEAEEKQMCTTHCSKQFTLPDRFQHHPMICVEIRWNV